MSYTVKTLVLSLVLIIITYLFVFSVDPYDKEGFDFWNIGNKAVTSSREMKFIHLDSGRNTYKAFIIGSSRVLRMDPSTVEKYTGLKTYNYGVENANAEDLLAETRHLIDKQKPEMIIMFVDFYMMNGYIGIDRRLVQSRLSKYLDSDSSEHSVTWKVPYFQSSYLTLRALRDSINLLVFRDRKPAEAIYLENGEHIKEEPGQKPKLAKEYFDNQYESFRKDNERLDMFREIKQLCQQNRIKLIVGQTPMNEEHLKKVLENRKLRKMFIAYKRELVDIFGEFYDFNNLSVSEYNGQKYWYDSVHPSENLAEIMLKKILDPQEKNLRNNFGKVVTSDEVESYLKSFQ